MSVYCPPSKHFLTVWRLQVEDGSPKIMGAWWDQTLNLVRNGDFLGWADDYDDKHDKDTHKQPQRRRQIQPHNDVFLKMQN